MSFLSALQNRLFEARIAKHSGRIRRGSSETNHVAPRLTVEPLESRFCLSSVAFSTYFGGSSDDQGIAIAVDAAGNSYLTGGFSGTADFDPGPGVFNLSSAGSFDAFVSKLDSAGNFVWARQMGGGSPDASLGVAVDGVGNVYTTGYLLGTADFDPGPGVFNLSSAGSSDAFVSKLDSTGNFVWARRMGGGSLDSSQGIALDNAGAVYTLGFFDGTADFDPGAGVFNLSSAGSDDAFVSNLDSAGNFIWVLQLGGNSSDYGFGIAIDSTGSVYAIGSTRSTNFPTTAPFQATNAGGFDAFITKIAQVIPVTPVTIDIKPGSDENPINLANQGVIPVTLFGSATFDVAQVDLGSVVFAGAHIDHSSVQDVNGDGKLDLVMTFRTQDTNLRAVYESLLADADTDTNGVLDSGISTHQLALVSLTGQTLLGEQFEGSDSADLFLSGRALREFLALLVSQGQI